MKFYNNFDLNKNEIQNFRVQNLAAAPSNPVIGQHYYNTTDNTEYVWNGTKWIDALSQGDYTFTDGIVESNRTVQLTAATIESIGGVIIGSNIDVEAGVISVKDASTSNKGLIEIATDAEAEGDSEVLAINPKQLNTKVTKNADITAGTATKITYDAKGLVTGGADLSEADIPEIHLAKVTDVTATATEVNVLDGIAVSTSDLNALESISGNVQQQLDGKVAKNDDITAGTATKITYDAKGLVTGGADLSAADIPSLDSAKINTLGSYAKATEAGAIGTTDTLNVALGKLEKKADDAVVGNEAITAGTHTKITYDAKGLVTAGADLSQADIPELNLSKVTDVTATAAEVNILDGAEITTTELNALESITGNVQAQLDDKVEKNTAITGATKTKITYDEKGLVTAGADLSEADIPTLGAAKIGNLTGYVIATEAAALAEGDTALEAFGKIQKSLDGKIGLSALSIESGSTDYLTYDASKGEIGAIVTDSVAQSSTDLITSGGVYEAVKDKIELTDLSVESGSANFASYDNTTGELTIKGGQANGLATLDASGLVPASQLPSYVDDVIELVAVTDTAPSTGNAGDKYFNTSTGKIMTYEGGAWGSAADPEKDKIYVNLANDMAYRWSGSAMVQIGADKLKGVAETITGDGTTTSFAVNHNLGTRDVTVEIYDTTTYEKIYVNVVHTSTSAITLVFGQAPSASESFRVVIHAVQA